MQRHVTLDRQCTYNVTLLLVFLTIVAIYKQYLLSLLFLAKTQLSAIERCYLLPLKCNNRFPLHCCRSAQYFVPLLTVVGITLCKSVCSCFSHAACKLSSLRRILFSSVACLSVPHFSNLSYKWQHFRKKIIERKLCVLTVFTNLSEMFLILKNNSAVCYHKYTQIFE